MSETGLEYLAPDFDPLTLTVPRLRSILVSHSVDYPSSAKKAQLVEIFNREVVPRSRQILSAQNRNKRSSRGIIDAESSQESNSVAPDNRSRDALLGSMVETPPMDENKQPRRSRRFTPNPDLPEAPRSRLSAEGRLDAHGSHKHPRESDADLPADAKAKRPMVRRTRRSEFNAVAEEQSLDMAMQRSIQEDSVFSDDNPFQAGSSPVGPDDGRVSGGRRGKSARLSTPRDVARRTTLDRAEKVDDGIVAPTAKEFKVRVANNIGRSGEDDSIFETKPIEAGEEFTPEEQLELVQGQLQAGVQDLLPPRPRKHQSNRGALSKSAPWAIILTLLGGYAAWWRREKLEVGYCGIGRSSSNALANIQLPDWASVLEPHCEICPQHAYCYANLETTCEANFVLRRHPLSLGGLIPLAPTCEPDGEKVRKVKSVADRAVEALEERRAKYECGELKNEVGKGGHPEVNEKDLKQKVAQKRRKSMSDAEFEELWSGAIGEILGRDEIISTVDRATGDRVLSSTSLARLPFGCAIQRSARLALARHRVEIGTLITLILALASARSYLISLRNARAQVPELVKLTLDRLATQAALHAQDERAVPEPWVSVGQLRDDVLRHEFSARRREELWKRVRAVVEMNANVRASVREARGGEISRVWEWIGSIGALDDGPSGGRRQSGRISFGVPTSASSSPALSLSSASSPAFRSGENRQDLARRWDEGRPVY